MIKNRKNIVIKVSFIRTASESDVCQSNSGNASCQFAVDGAVCQPTSDSAACQFLPLIALSACLLQFCVSFCL